MSWLNSSLNSLKGQITSFAQEVLLEGAQEEEINPEQILEETQKKYEDLSVVCASKDNEITALRRQIAELQAKCGESDRSSKSSLEKNASLEESWCWEPENIPSDSSAKNDNEGNSETSSGGEMITIPLDLAAVESGSYEKIPKSLEEKDLKLKKLIQENAVLNHKITELTQTNKILNANIEELDSQHNDAIQKLLDLKIDLQTNLTKVTSDYENLQKSYHVELGRYREELSRVEKKVLELEHAEKKYSTDNEDLKTNLKILRDCLTQQQTDNITLKTTLDIKEKQLTELVELIENWEQTGSNAESKLKQGNYSLKKVFEDLDLDFAKTKTEDGFIVLEDDDEDSNSFTRTQKSLEDLPGTEKDQESMAITDTEGQEREQQLVELKNKISSLEAENKVNVEKIKSLEELLLNEFTIKSHDQLQNVEEEFQNKTPTLKNENEDLQAKIVLLEKEKSVLEAENQIYLAKIKDTATCDPSTVEKYNDLKQQHKHLQKNFTKISEQITEIQESHRNLFVVFQEKIRDLENELSTNNGHVADLELKKVILEKEKSILEDNNKNYLERINALKAAMTIDPEDYEDLVAKNEHLQDNLQGANEEFMEYQEDQVKQRKKLEEKLELSEQQITTTNEKLKEKQIECEKLSTEILKLEEINQRYEIEIQQIQQRMENCEANASDMESKLMMENMNLHKQIIDMESSLNRSEAGEEKTKDGVFYTIDELKQILSSYLQTDLDTVDKETVATALKNAREKIAKIDILERNLKQMSSEINRLVSEKSTIEHESSTLQADVLNYEIECAELMKNNELLLNELENYKRNKLETIHENNEETIVVLEKQLEDSDRLNRSLEDEYNEVHVRLADLEREKADLLSKIENTQNSNENLNTKIKELSLKIEVLEAEKCNLVFELNEMKTDDKKSAMESEILEHRNKSLNLEAQLERLSKDHADLVATMQTLQSNLIESRKDAEMNVAELKQKLKEKDENLVCTQNALESLKTEFITVENKLMQAFKIDNKGNESFVNSLTTFVENLKSRLDRTLTENVALSERIKELESEKPEVPYDSNEYQQADPNIQNSNEAALHFEQLNQMKQEIEVLNKERTELIEAVKAKHAENVQYYMEIQRLGLLLQTNSSKPCENCIRLQNNISSITTAHAGEIEKLKDQINFLREKSDILTTNLLTEQTNQKLLTQQKIELEEENSTLNRDLIRLREHLVELEEAHTKDTLEMQNVVEETKLKMAELRNEVSQSSNAYTSASIRANQHAETLQAQCLVLSQQRDDLAAKLSTAQDQEQKNRAALVNLQCALEQFQREKEKDILDATQKIRNSLKEEEKKQKQLKVDIASLNQQLSDANQGLLAAARLSDQLEVSQITISSLREEITKLQNKNQILEEKFRVSETSQADKIEKSLIKSLIIGYIVSSNQNDKSQILRMIVTVLGFNQTETDKIGLNKSPTSWLGGFMHVGSTVTHSTDSLTRAFVNFLEQESRPRNDPSTMPNLLNIVSESSSTGNNKPNAAASVQRDNERRPSDIPTNSSAIQPILLSESVVDQFAPSRNSSSILKDILSDSDTQNSGSTDITFGK